MTEHLPECHLWLEPMLSEQDWCICARLRACEERVRAEERSWEGAVVVARAGYQDGYDAALRDAREAVKKLAKDTWCDSAPCWGAERFLAAIDALRGEQ
jgi:hypothetical protein